MPTQSDSEKAMAMVGYNVLETVGRAIGTFAFGVNPVSLGQAIGGLIGDSGSSSPWKGGSRPDVYQN